MFKLRTESDVYYEHAKGSKILLPNM